MTQTTSMMTLGEQFMMLVLQMSALVLAGMASLAKGRAVTEPPTESHSHCQPSCKQCIPQPIQCTGSTRSSRVGDDTSQRSLARESEWGSARSCRGALAAFTKQVEGCQRTCVFEWAKKYSGAGSDRFVNDFPLYTSMVLTVGDF